jgi:hypothetical protein
MSSSFFSLYFSTGSAIPQSLFETKVVNLFQFDFVSFSFYTGKSILNSSPRFTSIIRASAILILKGLVPDLTSI